MDLRTDLDRQAAAAFGMPFMAHRKPLRDGSDDLEARAAQAYERCHPGDSFGDLKARARFSKEDRGLLTDWMAAFAKMQDGEGHRSAARRT